VNATAAPKPVRRRWLRLAVRLTVRLALALVILALIAGWLLQPQRAGPFLLKRIGLALNLEITARSFDYRLRGTPQLVLDEVVARRPGDTACQTRVRVIAVAHPAHGWR